MALIEHLAGVRSALPDRVDLSLDDVLSDDDFHLALYCCYELHYRGFNISVDAEWDPAVLGFRNMLEVWFETALLERIPMSPDDRDASAAARLHRLIDDSNGPSLSRFMELEGQRWQMQEFAIHRSLYQLKEADPHTWAIPRFSGPARSALIEIQMDEYGNGKIGAAHSELFARTMMDLDLDPSYGAYLDAVGGPTLATTNLISMFGLHRRLLPALLGHLAVFENTSVLPMGRYARACERLGVGPAGRRFYEVHVVADELHGPLAADQMVAGFASSHPDTEDLIIWGATCLMEMEGRLTAQLLTAWARGETSLRPAHRDPLLSASSS